MPIKSGGKRDSLAGKTAIVTGADSGIGLCFCKELAARGCPLVMISIRNEELRKCSTDLARKYNIKTYPLTVDLCRPDAPDLVINYIDGLNLQPEILINNAGIFSFNFITETKDEKLNRFVDLHIRSVTLLTAKLARRMQLNKTGYIMNMASMACWAPMPGLAMYSATKAYIRVFTRALHYELRDSGVKVMVACPGGIATPLFGLPDNLMKIALALHAVQTPEKFAHNAINRMLKGKMQYINGFINRLAIFAVGICPTPVRMLVKHLMLDKGITR